MIFSEKFVFLELAKTGSTYARYVLMSLDNSTNENIGKKHNIFDSLSEERKKIFQSKMKVASIRNPYDWYVSLYAFACEHRGGLYTWTQIRPDVLSVKGPIELARVLGNHIQNRKKWRQVFSDVNSKENFKNFLHLIFFDDPLGAGFRYNLDGVSNIVGYYTYDYFRMCTYNFAKYANQIKDYAGLVKHHEDHFLLDLMLKNENLKNGLLENAERLCSSNEEMLRAIDARPKKSNTATKRNPYQYYYDDETKELVYSRDKFIIDRYGYSFEEL